MNRPILLIATISITATLAVVGVVVWQKNSIAHSPEDSTEAALTPNLSATEASDLFKKVLWRRPTETDQILHAQTNTLPTGQTQWFLKIKPSPSLLEHLKTKNAFSLMKTGQTFSTSNSPDWFQWSDQETEVWSTHNREMTLIYTASHLYAHGLFQEFQQGADTPEKVPSKIPPPKRGRLQDTSPPNDGLLQDLDP